MYYYVKVLRNVDKSFWETLSMDNQNLMIQSTLSKKYQLGYVSSKIYHTNDLVVVPFGKERFLGIVQNEMKPEEIKNDILYKEIIEKV